MGRAERLSIEGAWYHVVNRGAGRQRVFFTQGDGIRFEHLLAAGNERFGVEVHACCLMGNHFHLLLHCPSGGLSEFMHLIGSQYARHVNDRLGRDGPVFRARFRSLLVADWAYRAQVGRYIHRNPLDLTPRVRLDRYRWSSYRYYVRSNPPPPWLHTDVLLGVHGGDRASYRRYVEDASVVSPSGAEVLLGIADLIADEHGDMTAAQRRGLRRAVGVALLDRLAQPVRSDLETLLAFPSDDALRLAKRRATERLASDPDLVRIVEHVIALAS